MPIDLHYLPLPVTLRTGSPISDEVLMRFSRHNKPFRIERNKHGEITIMTPVGGIGGHYEHLISGAFIPWVEDTHEGIAFGPSTGFNLPDGSCLSPDGSCLSPDGSWISSARWNALTPDEQAGFPPLCPDFLIELRSRSDSRSQLEAKMQLWLENGAQLAWLIDPRQASVTIYRPGQPEQTLRRPDLLEADHPAQGLKLRTSLLWPAS